MNFAEAIKNEQKWTRTENGAVALNTTGTALLDLFSTIGALRSRHPMNIETMVEEAYKEDALNTVKCIFYARDVREGLGEREVPRIALNYLARKHPEAIIKNIHLISEYGRWDDIYCLIDTPVEDKVWNVVHTQLKEDLKNMKENKPISLLGKWLKSIDTSSKKSRNLGRRTAEKLNWTDYRYTDWRKYRPYQRLLSVLRSYIKVVEKNMCANEWDMIDYESVPSRALMIHGGAFDKHDKVRYNEFINKVEKGEAKINAGTLYPYDLISRYLSYYGQLSDKDETVEAIWNNLPNYVEEGTNAIVIADTSGSMLGRPLNSSIGLAIYFAERNTGAYHNLWMNFSNTPYWRQLKGNTLHEKIRNIGQHNFSGNTNLKKAFELVLETAINNNVSREDMPKSLIIISDMEIDYCGDRNWTFYDKMKAEFANYGYEIPQIIFWNVDSRHDVFHADSKRKGVILCSGQSTTTFKTLVNTISMTPTEYMMKVLGSDRYKAISL